MRAYPKTSHHRGAGQWEYDLDCRSSRASIGDERERARRNWRASHEACLATFGAVLGTRVAAHETNGSPPSCNLAPTLHMTKTCDLQTFGPTRQTSSSCTLPSPLPTFTQHPKR
eukprot:362353-Chlamydomonas_euryale.AAC.2